MPPMKAQAKHLMKVDEDKLHLSPAPQIHLQPFTPVCEVHPYEEVRKAYISVCTLGPNPACDRIVAVGLMIDNEEPLFITCPDERSLLDTTRAYLTTNKIKLLIGHNLMAFDLPFLTKRGDKYNISFPLKISNPKQKISSSSVNGKPIEYNDIWWKGVEILDTFHQSGIYDKSHSILTSYELQDVAIHIGARDEARPNLSHSEISTYCEAGNLTPILDALKYDLEDTKALGDFFIPTVYYQQTVVPMSLQQLATASPARKWQSILDHHYGKDRSLTPDEKHEIHGGHCSANPGLYRNCFKLDVSSMYPSIQLTYKLRSLKDPDYYHLSALNYFMHERQRLKRLAKETGEAKYSAMQNAYKVLINGGYGFLGTPGYSYNCYRTAALITAYGRRLMNLMIEESTRAGAMVVEVDTDGIILTGADPQTIFEHVQTALPAGIQIELDWTGASVYVPKIKNYVVIHSDGTPEPKGIFRRRDRSKLQKEFPIAYIKAYLESPERAESVYQEIRHEIEAGQCPLSYLAITENISKSAKKLVEAGVGKPGEKVTYYLTEEKRSHKCTDTPLKSRAKTVLIDSSEPYWPKYYLERLSGLKDEIDGIISKSEV